MGALVDTVKGFASGGGGGGGAAAVDPYMGFFAVAAAIAIGFMGWSFLGVRSDAEELAVQVEVGVPGKSFDFLDLPLEFEKRAFESQTIIETVGRLAAARL